MAHLVCITQFLFVAPRHRLTPELGESGQQMCQAHFSRPHRYDVLWRPSWIRIELVETKGWKKAKVFTVFAKGKAFLFRCSQFQDALLFPSRSWRAWTNAEMNHTILGNIEAWNLRNFVVFWENVGSKTTGRPENHPVKEQRKRGHLYFFSGILGLDSRGTYPK